MKGARNKGKVVCTGACRDQQHRHNDASKTHIVAARMILLFVTASGCYKLGI